MPRAGHLVPSKIQRSHRGLRSVEDEGGGAVGWAAAGDNRVAVKISRQVSVDRCQEEGQAVGRGDGKAKLILEQPGVGQLVPEEVAKDDQ